MKHNEAFATRLLAGIKEKVQGIMPRVAPVNLRKPKIDFVVPCYNYAHYLPMCVNTLLQQSVRDVRVLIVNDASPDNTREVAEALAASDKRVSVLHHERNQGMVASINDGIAWAQAEYLLLISADDVLVPGAVERALSVLDANPDIGMVYGHCPLFTDANAPTFNPDEPSREFTWERIEGIDLIKLFCAAPSDFIETPTCIVRTSLQKQIGGYLPELPHCCDFEMWLRFAAHGAVASIQTLQAYRRDHPGAMNKQYFADRWPDFEQRVATFNALFRDHSDRIPDADKLHAQVIRELAEDSYWSSLKLMAGGRFAAGKRLMGLALTLRPSLKYRPPFGWALKRIAQLLHIKY